MSFWLTHDKKSSRQANFIQKKLNEIHIILAILCEYVKMIILLYHDNKTMK